MKVVFFDDWEDAKEQRLRGTARDPAQPGRARAAGQGGAEPTRIPQTASNDRGFRRGHQCCPRPDSYQSTTANIWISISCSGSPSSSTAMLVEVGL